MVSLDIYLNETTRHADVILPGRRRWRTCTTTWPFPQLSWRNHARYSPPVLPPRRRASRRMADLLKLAAIVLGGGGRPPTWTRWTTAESRRRRSKLVRRPMPTR
jgi:anaerobic selenocysteine-containing dehydrogenase